MHTAAQAIVAGARGGRPGFLEVDAYRFYGHARMDKSPYRTPEEEREGRDRDPLKTARSALDDDATLDRIDGEANAEMDQAMEGAIASSTPAADTMFQDVYDPSTPAPQPQRARLTRSLGGAAVTMQTTYRDALRQAMTDAMTEDEAVIVMGEEVGLYGGAYGVHERVA